MRPPDLPLFVSPSELHGVIETPGLRIIAVDEPADFEANHIPSAVRIGYGDITRNSPPVRGLMPSPEALAETLSAIGLQPGERVVAYDRSGGGQAGRLLFTLDALGHDRLSLLDGGLVAWASEGLPLESGAVACHRSEYAATLHDERIADRALIRERLGEPDFKLLDTRSIGEYTGADTRAARNGHIPGAAHLDWVDLKDGRDRLRPSDELLALLAERGIEPGDEVVTYCQSHQRSSYAYFALKALGFDRVRGYPGAWSDWGNAGDTPVEQA